MCLTAGNFQTDFEQCDRIFSTASAVVAGGNERGKEGKRVSECMRAHGRAEETATMTTLGDMRDRLMSQQGEERGRHCSK